MGYLPYNLVITLTIVNYIQCSQLEQDECYFSTVAEAETIYLVVSTRLKHISQNWIISPSRGDI